MLILYGKKNTGSVPVAVFETQEGLGGYVNSLYKPYTATMDHDKQAASVLVDCTEHQTSSVAQIWATCDDWVEQLQLAKLCPLNPTALKTDVSDLELKKADLQAQLTAVLAEIACKT